MRRIILDLAVTLDGYIEGPNGETDWCILDDDMDFPGFLEGIDTILYGRVSYDLWGNYRPEENASEAEKALWSAVHSKKKIVFSKNPELQRNTDFTDAGIPETVARLKRLPGKDIWLYGGAGLIATFIEEGLVDVFRLSVHPTVLGSGKPLFGALRERHNLRLAATRPFRSGVVQLEYETLK